MLLAGRCVACGRAVVGLQRGRCQTCYNLAAHQVRRGKTSWTYLERSGFAAAPGRRGRKSRGK